MAGPGRAQQAPRGRFAFADTTLLRDTLGLSFDGLFPIADSLGMVSDTLRALSIRYRYTLPRMLKLSDSLGVVVDSVGPVMRRERFNPLATTQRGPIMFTYRSTYEVEQYSTAWTNGSEFFVPAGEVRISGNTSSRFDRREQGGRSNLDQTRVLNTRADWVFSRNLSAGGVVDLSRTDNRARGTINNFKTDDNRFSLSVMSHQQPRRGMTSELSLSSGLVNYSGSSEEKRGLSGGLNGRVRNTSGSWFTHDASGGFSGNLARTRLPGAEDYSRTTDFSDNLRGTLALYTNAPMGLNLSYNLRDSKVETAADSGRTQQVLSGSQGLDMAFRARRDNDRYVTVGTKFGNSQQASPSSPSTQNSRRDRGLNTSGRYRVRAWSLDGSFGRTLATSRYPRRGVNGGYAEDRDSRSVDGTLTWVPSNRFTVRANGTVRLERLRYSVLGSYPNLPVARDQYDQSYRADGKYTFSPRFNTGVVLEVGRSLYVNIPAASTAANTETRRYRANWDWTFHLLPGLTATQNNSLNASYVYYTFLPASADRLVLDYFTHTTVNADVTPHLHIDVSHDFRYQPTGGYAPLDPPLDDGNSYFSQADENFLSILGSRLTYSLGQALSISVIPTYTATDRNGISEGATVKQNATRTLNLSGAANLNFPIGRKGQITGGVSKNFYADRRITYTSGVPDNQPSTERDFWSGRLELSWDL